MPKIELIVQLTNALNKIKTTSSKRIDFLISRLLDEKIDLDQMINGETLLILAIKKRNNQVTNALLAANVSVNIPDNHGETPLMFASACMPEIIPKLILAGALVDFADPRAHNTLTALMCAAYDGSVESIRMLLDAKASINLQRDGNDATALIFAVEREQLDCVDLLVKEGAKLELEDSTNQTALDLAVEFKYIPIVNTLLSHGALIRDSQELYELLMDADGLTGLPALVALYKQQKHSFEMAGDYNELNEKQFKHLEKIKDFHELHHANIYGLIDQATNFVMPKVLINLIGQYNSSEENTIEKVSDQYTSFFYNTNRMNGILKKEKAIEAGLLHLEQDTIDNNHHHKKRKKQ